MIHGGGRIFLTRSIYVRGHIRCITSYQFPIYLSPILLSTTLIVGQTLPGNFDSSGARFLLCFISWVSFFFASSHVFFDTILMLLNGNGKMNRCLRLLPTRSMWTLWKRVWKGIHQVLKINYICYVNCKFSKFLQILDSCCTVLQMGYRTSLSTDFWRWSVLIDSKKKYIGLIHKLISHSIKKTQDSKVSFLPQLPNKQTKNTFLLHG